MFDRLYDLAAQIPWSVVAWFVVLLIFYYQLKSMLHTVGEYERLAVFFHGHFQQFKGPGLVVSLPFHQVSYRVPIGVQGVLMANNIARFDGIDLPVRHAGGFSLGTRIQITGFDERTAIVEEATNVSMRRCPECGHEFH